MKAFTYERASSPAEAAFAVARNPASKFIAGGTNLLDLMKLQIEAPTHLVDVNGAAAEDLDLYIAGSRPDPVPNLLHRADNQVNDDVTLYEVYFFNKFAGQWASLCPYHDATGGATAMAIAETSKVPPTSGSTPKCLSKKSGVQVVPNRNSVTGTSRRNARVSQSSTRMMPTVMSTEPAAQANRLRSITNSVIRRDRWVMASAT